MTDTTPTPSTCRDGTARRRTSRKIVFVSASLVGAALVATGIGLTTTGRVSLPAAIAQQAADGYRAPSPGFVAELPAAVYDAVLPGLVPWTEPSADAITRTATITADVPLYGEDRDEPVGRLLAEDFLDNPTTVVPVATDGLWTLVLTPARVQLPSKAGDDAPAQSAGWVRTDVLEDGVALDSKVAVSESEQTLTVTRGDQSVVYDVGVGTAEAPTPIGVTGYLQARYLDPSQGQSTYPIQLTSLHSTAADEPYQGDDGGLIGAHYSNAAAGSVSHGCIRLTHAAAAALNQLPLGTPITISA